MTCEIIPLPVRSKAAVVCVDAPGELHDMLAFKAARNSHRGTADDLLALAALIERRVAEVRNIIAQQDEARNGIMGDCNG